MMVKEQLKKEQVKVSLQIHISLTSVCSYNCLSWLIRVQYKEVILMSLYYILNSEVEVMS